ncbi:hypothetical protein GCM10023114_45550 [Mycolicibacterium sediminis]
MWFLDLLLVPAMALLYGGGAVAVVVAVLVGRRWSAWVLVVPVIVVLTVLVNPGWRVASGAYFQVHRPLFDLALGTAPGPSYYGAPLPLPLRFLTVTGKVSSLGEEGSDGRFFPQWAGIPDDAGGYLYSPGGSPVGVDLYGSLCADPVDLGDDWWMCGLADNGL